MAVDCHVHLVGDRAAYPQEDRRTYTALPASIEELLVASAPAPVFLMCWAPYCSGGDPRALKPDPQWLRALLEVAPDRCVWGSDWPFNPPREAHCGAAETTPNRDLDYAEVLAAFAGAVDDAGLLDDLLNRNADRLYGLDPATT